MALKSDGTVWAWGNNGAGQLGNGTTTVGNTPVQVSGLSGARAIAAGGTYGLAVASPAPAANPQFVGTNENTAVPVPLTGSSATACDLTFSIVTPPANGALGAIANNACAAGSPNSDSASVTYTPNNSWSGADSFTFKVNDRVFDSAPATVSVTVNPPVQTTPVITWPAPAAITYGSALSAEQLNAAASVAGALVYSPAAGTVPPVGTQILSVTFTPNDSTDYLQATASVPITVNPAPTAGVNLVVTRTLARASGSVVATITIANTGGANAQNVVLSTAKIGSVSGTPLPQTLGAINAGTSARVTVTFPGTAGGSGTASSMSLSGSFTGGTFSSNARITLP